MGLKHHISILLVPSTIQLANYAPEETPDQMRLEMTDLIEAAQKPHATVSNSANTSLQPLAESSSIPPAAPRVLLVTLVLNKPEIVSVLSEDMEGGLRKYHSKNTFDMATPLFTNRKVC